MTDLIMKVNRYTLAMIISNVFQNFISAELLLEYSSNRTICSHEENAN